MAYDKIQPKAYSELLNYPFLKSILLTDYIITFNEIIITYKFC